MKTLFFVLGLLVLVGSASAITTLSSFNTVRFNQTVSAGDSVFFDITVSPDKPEETSVDHVEVSGDCASWISMDTTGQALPATYEVRIAVPAGASNGRHRCDIDFVLPATGGMANMAMRFPVTVNVIGGTAPTPTPAPTEEPTQDPVTTEPTTAPTTEQPTTERTTIKPTSTVPTPWPTTSPKTTYASFNVMHLIIAGAGFWWLLGGKKDD